MKKGFTNELKTGIVVIAGILIAVGLWLRTSTIAVDTYSVKTDFGHAEGIKVNSVVALGGIERS